MIHNNNMQQHSNNGINGHPNVGGRQIGNINNNNNTGEMEMALNQKNHRLAKELVSSSFVVVVGRVFMYSVVCVVVVWCLLRVRERGRKGNRERALFAILGSRFGCFYISFVMFFI